MTSLAIGADRDLVARARPGAFYSWVKRAWPYLESARFVDNWHIEEICAHLEAVGRVEIRDLVINIPPGCMKSSLVCELWNVWCWLRDPTTCFIVGSFDQTLVTRQANRIVGLCSQAWFRERWGDMFPRGNPSATNLENAAGGFRFATSPGGKGTGRHANIVIVDDPIKPRDAHTGRSGLTKKALNAVHEWLTQTLSTRQKDPATHRFVMVMQRLSFEDPTAEALEKPGVVHLRLPMHFDSARRCVTGWGGDRRTLDGELLYPGRYDAASVAKVARDLGPLGTAAQHEQNPGVAGGTIFRREMWRFWSATPRNEPCLCAACFASATPIHDTGRPCAVLPPAGQDVQSWDMSFKGGDGNDFTAGTWWRHYQGSYYLRDILNERLSFSAAKLAILRALVMWPAATVLVENAANGSAVASEVPSVELVTPEGGKVSRAHAAEALFAIGAVYLPHPAEVPAVWVLCQQGEAFPTSVNDDMIDSVSQALVWYRARGAHAYLAALAAANPGRKNP